MVEDSDGDEDKSEAADGVGPLPGNTNTEGGGVDANATQVKPVWGLPSTVNPGYAFEIHVFFTNFPNHGSFVLTTKTEMYT